MQENVYLIGLMGAGKTTVGRKLADLLQFDFLDTDQELEQRNGVSVSHIFEVEGEEGFRLRESRLLEEVSTGKQSVIATGGGIVLKPENRIILRKSGVVVYLRAPISILWQRLKGCQNRPLLQADNPKKRISDLMTERDPLYVAEADYIVQVTNESAAKMAQKIYALVQ